MRSLQLGSIMAYLLLYLAPLLLLLVMMVNCGQAMATPTPVVQHVVAGERIDNGQSQDTRAGMVTVDTTCMTEWLLISNFSRARAVAIPGTPPAIQAMLDEKVVKLQRHFVLSLILGYVPQLATNLKNCVDRRPECPTADLIRHLPCSLDGECVFNTTQQSAVCVCPAGLTGRRCDVDIDECSQPDMNNCDQPAVATCYNIHGSFTCECNTGYYGRNGRVCYDLDECTAGAHQCNEHAMCNNTVGSYSCYCQSGYKGDGTNCQLDVCGSSANSELCYQIEDMKTYNKNLEEKLEARDIQINQLLSDVKIPTTIFIQQKTKVDQMEIEVNHYICNVLFRLVLNFCIKVS
ncbi:vitamin K-dependent protein S-like [Sycon ciliatum]|uniref:vitamin K-dependent protein S-like n=1 Tax=Sycon ciliatum TaxID=27933 RepID=UPI0031F6B57D